MMLIAALALSQAQAQEVVIYADNPYVAARSAATRLGLGVSTFTSDGPGFRAAYGSGRYALVVVESPGSSLPADVVATVGAAIAAGTPVLFSWWSLNTDPALQATLGLSSVTSYSTPVAHTASPSAPVNFFADIGGSLSGHTLDAGDNGDYLNVAASGWVAATGPAGNTVVVTLGDSVIVNGFLPYDFQTTDRDRDGVVDVEELYAAQINYLLGAGGPSLTISGSCPGPMRIEVSGMTPRGDYAILSSARTGATAMPAGPCAGGVTGLGSLTLRALLTADASGNGVISPSIPAGACGNVVQVVDLSTCALTPVREL